MIYRVSSREFQGLLLESLFHPTFFAEWSVMTSSRHISNKLFLIMSEEKFFPYFSLENCIQVGIERNFGIPSFWSPSLYPAFSGHNSLIIMTPPFNVIQGYCSFWSHLFQTSYVRPLCLTESSIFISELHFPLWNYFSYFWNP